MSMDFWDFEWWALDYVLFAYQEWTEEDEGHKVEVGKLAATLWVCIPWQGVTLLTPQTCQHDLVPRLSCCTPKTQEDFLDF